MKASRISPSARSGSKAILRDSTTQALGTILAGNPRGVLWYRDELAGLLSDLGRYDNKGE